MDETTPTGDTVNEPADSGTADPHAADARTDAAADRSDDAPVSELDQLAAERDEFRSIAQRLQADFENYKKRVAAMQADEIDRATGRFAEALLPVLDACEAAFTHGVDGVEPIWSALIGGLQKLGLEAMDLLDKPFDPAVAEAVAHEPAGLIDAQPVVIEIMRTGYSWKGRVLRPAMVKVRS